MSAEDEGAEAYEKRHQLRKLATIQAQAKQYGMELVPVLVGNPAEVTG